MTPPLPDWIRKHDEDGYRNLFSYCPEETHLYGTEDLYGDWNGQVLLLAKDFACTRFIEDRIEKGDKHPYRHDPDFETNKRLRRRVEGDGDLRTGRTSSSCGILYGSALACLLRDDGTNSGRLPHGDNWLGFGSDVLKFTVRHMPRLEAILCLGDEASMCARTALAPQVDWRAHRDRNEAVKPDRFSIIFGFHPVARVGRERSDPPWERLRQALGTCAAAA